MATFTMTTFNTALQNKLNSANISLSAQDYLLLTKALKDAIEISDAVETLAVRGVANGVASLDANIQVPAAQLINALPAQSGNSGKLLTTNGSTASWTGSPTFTSLQLTTVYVGAGALDFNTSAELTSAMGVFNITSSINSYGQLAVHNATSSSSTDIIAYANNGVDAAGWIDMGITGATFNSATYGITGAHDGYIFMSAPVGTAGMGNLVIATGDNGTDNHIVFAAGGYSSGNTQMTIFPDDRVHIEIPTPSTSATTGALTVVGGVGISGDMNVQGDVAIQGTITFGGAGTTVETSNLSVTDPLLFVGKDNVADLVDLGFIGEYSTTVSTITKTVSNKALTSNVATLTTSTTHGFAVGDYVVVSSVDATFNGTYVIASVPTTTTFTYAKTNANVTSAVATGSAVVSSKRRFSGAVRDASDGVVKVFKDATTKPTSTINFSEAGLAYADVQVAGLTASSLTIGDVSATEIGYLDGVSSSIQTQLNAKAPSAGPTFTGTVTLPATVTAPSSVVVTLPTTTGTLATTADVATAVAPYAPLIQPTTTPTFSSNAYTLQSTDKDKIILASNSSTAATITIPTGTFATGTVLTIVQTGTGQITLASSGTLNSNGNKLKLNGQFASCQIIVTATNTFLIIGNMAA
jgi:hypothetical protein